MINQSDCATTYATPKQVAKRLKISERRVRHLLSSGRMSGIKKNGKWLAIWPLRVSSGKRGPDMTNYPTRLLN